MAECRYKGWCRIEDDTAFDVCYPCIGDWGETCAEYEPMPDTKALLALADEMEQIADGNRLTGLMAIGRAWSWADRIREACGVESEAAGRHVDKEKK